jgi:hypothetical protein
MIVAGKKSQVLWGNGNWAFLDVGFANEARTCGYAFGNEPPRLLRFGEVREELVQVIAQSASPVNLVIEAPLSVAFDMHGNPKGRRIERQGKETRYWYVGLGCAVMTAALYIVRYIIESETSTTVKLFEGFVSFKQRGTNSKHMEDVNALRNAVKESTKLQDSSYSPVDLTIDNTDVLQSAFYVSGIDCGIPAVIVPHHE